MISAVETKPAHKRLGELQDMQHRAITMMEEELHYAKRAMTRLLEEVSKSDSFEFLKDHWEECHQQMQILDQAERSAYTGLCDSNEGMDDLYNELYEQHVIAEETAEGSWRVEMMRELYGL